MAQHICDPLLEFNHAPTHIRNNYLFHHLGTIIISRLVILLESLYQFLSKKNSKCLKIRKMTRKISILGLLVITLI